MAIPADPKLSKPTTCLGYHLVVQMTFNHNGDIWDFWQYPSCGRGYPVRLWKIKAAK